MSLTLTPAADSAAAPRRVLVVDDVPEIAQFFRSASKRLSTVPIDLVCEVDSRKALQLVQETPFDLVVTDFRMQHVDGLQILQESRKSNPTGVRLLMTGYNEIPADIGAIRAAGVDVYLPKPLRTRELLLLLADLILRNEAVLAKHRQDARELEKVAAMEQSTTVTTSTGADAQTSGTA